MRRKRLTKKVLDGLWMGLMHAHDVMSVDGDMWPDNHPDWKEWQAAHDWLVREIAVRKNKTRLRLNRRVSEP